MENGSPGDGREQLSEPASAANPSGTGPAGGRPSRHRAVTPCSTASRQRAVAPCGGFTESHRLHATFLGRSSHPQAPHPFAATPQGRATGPGHRAAPPAAPRSAPVPPAPRSSPQPPAALPAPRSPPGSPHRPSPALLPAPLPSAVAPEVPEVPVALPTSHWPVG